MPTSRFCEFCKLYFEENLEIHQLNCTERGIHTENRSDASKQSTGYVQEKSEGECYSDEFSTYEELTTYQEQCSSSVEGCNIPEHTEKHSMEAFAKCFYCDTKMSEEELISHSPACDFSLVRCEKCQVQVTRRYMVHHLSVDCIKRMIQCEYCSCDLVADALQKHFEVCDVIPVCCEQKCGKEIRRKELQQHMDEECPKRVMECKYCAKGLEAELLENHYSQCEKFPVSCPKVCGQSVLREDVERHLEEACGKLYGKCMYQSVSCTFEGFPVDLRRHIQENNHFHAEITIKKIEELSTVVENLKSIVTTLENKLKTRYPDRMPPLYPALE